MEQALRKPPSELYKLNLLKRENTPLAELVTRPTGLDAA